MRRRRPTCKQILLILLTMTVTSMVLTWRREEVSSSLSTQRHIYTNLPNMTLMVRTAATAKLMTQFYCMFLRTTVLFWPAVYGDMLLILDDNSTSDKQFGRTVLRQMHQHFPEYNFRVIYEPLPQNGGILEGKYKPAAYTQQLWSQFFSHTYTTADIIAYMDTDVLLLTPMTRETLVNGNKLKVFGYSKIQHWVVRWEKTTLKALGLPLVVNFMITFPQLIHRDTYVDCKRHIMRHLNVTDFEAAFSLFHWEGTMLSPVNILLSYAWYHHKHRYHWHIKVPDLQAANNRLPPGHAIQPEDTVPDLVPVAHVSDTKKWIQERVTPGYCLSRVAQGDRVPAGCMGVTHNLSRMCNYHERVFHSPWDTPGGWCREGPYEACCKGAVDEHYRQVRLMALSGVHTVHRGRAELVSTLAEEMGVTCKALNMP